jgi:outer membrane protein assembly factor BamB
MIALKNFSLTALFIISCIFLYIFFSAVPSMAQQTLKNIELVEPVNFSLPFKLCFQKPDKSALSVEPASDKAESIFIPFQGGKIAKINLSSNPVVWMSDLGGEISSNLIFDHGKLYLITKVFEEELKKNTNSGKQLINYTLWSLEAETGLTDWQLGFTSDTTVSLDIYQDEIFLIANNGTVNLIKKTNGKRKILSKRFEQIISSPPSFFADKIYIGTEDNSILVVSINDAEIVSKIKTVQAAVSALVATEDKLYWGEKKGFVNSFNINNNSLIWSVRYGGEISSLTLVSNGILVTSLDNFAYFTSLQKGKKVWRRRLAGRVLAKPLIIGNFAILITATNNQAVILDLRNGKIVNQISLADIGFILSKPLLLKNSLVFSTNKGVFSFVTTNINCTQN